MEGLPARDQAGGTWSATSLVREKGKGQDKDNGQRVRRGMSTRGTPDERGGAPEQRSASRTACEEADAARIKETQAEVQREVERSIREAQRESAARKERSSVKHSGKFEKKFVAKRGVKAEGLVLAKAGAGETGTTVLLSVSRRAFPLAVRQT